MDEDLLVAVRELHRLHVHVVLEGGRGLCVPCGVGVEGAGDLRGGHGHGVREDGHGDDHVDDDLVDGAALEDEADGLEDVRAALAPAEEGGVGVRGGDEVAVDGGRADADAEAVPDFGEHGDAARVEDGVVGVCGVADFAAEVEEVDVARGEVLRDLAAPVPLASGDEDASRGGVERGAEVLDRVVRAGEAGHGGRDLEVAADGDGVGASEEHADVGGGHGAWLVTCKCHVDVFFLNIFF